MAGAGRPGRKRGTPKTGGRKRGTPNKRTQDLIERVEAAMGSDWCPIVELARIASDPKTALDMRVRCLSEVAPYLQPKRRAVEHAAHSSLEELVSQSLPGRLKAARERVLNGRSDAPTQSAVAKADDLQTTPTVQPVPSDTQPAQATPPVAVAPPLEPPPRLTAITDMSPQPPVDYDPYA